MTIKRFLRGRIKKNNLWKYLYDNRLLNVEIDDFFKKFGKMTRGELINFLKDGENAYEIAKFGYRYKGRDNIKAQIRYSYDDRETEQAY